MGSACPLTQLIFTLSSQGLFLSSLLIFLLPDLFWPRACAWGMLEEWSALLWERILTNSVCLQLPQLCSSDHNTLSKLCRWKSPAPSSTEWTLELEEQVRNILRRILGWKEFWLPHHRTAWQGILLVKKATAKWIGPTHLDSALTSIFYKFYLKDFWRPTCPKISGTQDELALLMHGF